MAVPAQPAAGVVKGARRGTSGQLEEEAALGRKYLENLRGEVVRLALLADRELDGRAMKSLAGKLSRSWRSCAGPTPGRPGSGFLCGHS